MRKLFFRRNKINFFISLLFFSFFASSLTKILFFNDNQGKLINFAHSYNNLALEQGEKLDGIKGHLILELEIPKLPKANQSVIVLKPIYYDGGKLFNPFKNSFYELKAQGLIEEQEGDMAGEEIYKIFNLNNYVPIEGIKIINNTDKTILLKEINNDFKKDEDFLSIDQDKYNDAGSLFLLPDKFIKDELEQINCKERNLLDDKIILQKNICIFEKPIIIKPNEIAILKPQLFVTDSFSTFSLFYIVKEPGNLVFLDGKDHQDIIFLNLQNSKKYVFLSNRFKTTNYENPTIGGFIYVNPDDKYSIKKIFKFQTDDGNEISIDNFIIQTKQGTSFKYFSDLGYFHSLPLKEFALKKNEFSENLLAFQIFLYKNKFLSKDQITGKYDDSTINAIKEFQKFVGLNETGKIDKATIYFTSDLSFNFDGGCYECYGGDFPYIISLNAPKNYFRLFADDTSGIPRLLSERFSSSSLIAKITLGPQKEGCVKNYDFNCKFLVFSPVIKPTSSFSFFSAGEFGKKNKSSYLYLDMKILNNTPSVSQCNVSSQNGKVLKKFKIFPNDIYPLQLFIYLKKSPTKQIYKLKCNNKSLDIKLF